MQLSTPCGRILVSKLDGTQGLLEHRLFRKRISNPLSVGQVLLQKRSKNRFLGNSTISAAAPKPKSNKSELYKLLAQAQKTLQPIKHRTCGCSRYVVEWDNPKFEVPVVSDGVRHSFTNLTICKSVWACPVCAYKIQSIRSKQLIEAMRLNRILGGSSLFLTLTFPHTRQDELSLLLVSFSKALSSMKARRRFKAIINELGIHSKVRSLETTWGEANGWHPHSHEVYFSDRILTVPEVEKLNAVIYEEWRKACIAAGLGEPSKKYGVKIDYLKSEKDDQKIGSYMCKFAHEVAMSGSKTSGDENRYTPFSMLVELQNNYNYRLACKYREYVEAFQGKRQIFGLTELLKRFGLDDKSDEAAANEGVVRETVDTLSLAEFNTIAYYNKQSQVIGIYDRLGKDEARRYIENLCIKRVNEFEKRIDSRKSLKKEIKESTFKAMIREGLSGYLL